MIENAVDDNVAAVPPGCQSRDDPQAALLDALTDMKLLDLLGPSWAAMSAAERLAYAFPGGRLPELRHIAPADLAATRRWWEGR